MKVSLLVSTYNWPQALELVLQSVKRQTQLPDEVLIADDGSTAETKTLIESFKSTSGLNIRHFWHEDQGFRKAIILNKAIAQAKSDYIIQVDGDCVMHKNFVKDHLSLAEKNTYLYGSRVTITKELLPRVLQEKKIDFHLLSRGIKKRTRTLHVPFLANQYRPKQGLSKKVRGCNISYWRDDFIAVNGYNEDFSGWGREDSEMVIRMVHNGVLGKRLRYKGIVFHLWHKDESRDNLDKNDTIEEKTKTKELCWCEHGIAKYLS